MPRRNDNDDDGFGTVCGIKSVNEYVDKVQATEGHGIFEIITTASILKYIRARNNLIIQVHDFN